MNVYVSYAVIMQCPIYRVTRTNERKRVRQTQRKKNEIKLKDMLAPHVAFRRFGTLDKTTRRKVLAEWITGKGHGSSSVFVKIDGVNVGESLVKVVPSKQEETDLDERHNDGDTSSFLYPYLKFIVTESRTIERKTAGEISPFAATNMVACSNMEERVTSEKNCVLAAINCAINRIHVDEKMGRFFSRLVVRTTSCQYVKS